jgi:hypothetical protein
MRVKFYREHKYVSAALNSLERLIAKTDFRKDAEVEVARSEWVDLSAMLHGHAHYEEERLHPLLERKGSTVHRHAHHQHEEMDATFPRIDALFEAVMREEDQDTRVEIGDQLYLTFRKFVGENLLHLHEEETKILPELQRLYTDEELRSVEDATYSVMTCEEMIAMLQVLFPHMNALDKEAFLEDIKFLQPEKFEKIAGDAPIASILE